MSMFKNLSIATAVLPAVLLAIAEPSLAASIKVFEPDAIVRGKTQAEWSAKWWKNFLSLPNDQSPLFDETGANADNGQPGPVYFLAGRLNNSNPVERTITVPKNKPIFFPLVNTLNFNFQAQTADELRQEIKNTIPGVDTLFATLDGVDVPNLFARRETSPREFSVKLQDSNFTNGFLPAGTYKPAVADGYWAMLAPLSKGNHELNFGGTDFDNASTGQNITYHIKSVPEPSSVLGTLAVGVFGAGWMLKRKLTAQTKAKSLLSSLD